MEFPDTGWNALPHQLTLSILGRFGDTAPAWLHLVLHTVLIWMPLFLALVLISTAIRLLFSKVAQSGRRDRPSVVAGLPAGIYNFVLSYARQEQIILVIGGLAAMPVLYATLELPKIIINSAIESGHFPIVWGTIELSQTAFLFVLCAGYLVAILINGALKYWLNIRKGRVGERLLRRLRLTVFRHWRRRADAQSRNGEIVPLIAQELEPIGGFAAQAFATPVFQGGTFLTIIIFMFVQDFALGAAALTLLPVQLVVIPRLQRRINALARRRLAEIRTLGGELTRASAERESAHDGIRTINGSFKRIEAIRLQLHRIKFFMKALNNFLTALTPLFFYSLGGYLVIQGDLSLGALVAALAAYKDFSAPLKELFGYYQNAEDARIRYADLRGVLASGSPSPSQFRECDPYPIRPLDLPPRIVGA